MNPQLQQYATDSYNSSKALENQFNQQAAQRVGEYNTAYNNAQTAQSNLSNFTKNMQSGSDVYAKQLSLANQNAGYDVNNLNQAQNQVSQLTGVIGGLPRAIQATNANYGATAGNVANQLSTTGANLNQSLQLANQNAQNQLSKQQAGLTGAQQGTSAFIQTQDQQEQAYAATAANAANIMQNAQTTMNAIQKLAQDQGNYTAQQQQIWAQAQSDYAAAKASLAGAQQAIAQSQYIRAQTAGQNLSNQQVQQYLGSKAYQNYLDNGTTTGSTPTTSSTSNNSSNGSDWFTNTINNGLNSWNKTIQNNGWATLLGKGTFWS